MRSPAHPRIGNHETLFNHELAEQEPRRRKKKRGLISQFEGSDRKQRNNAKCRSSSVHTILRYVALGCRGTRTRRPIKSFHAKSDKLEDLCCQLWVKEEKLAERVEQDP